MAKKTWTTKEINHFQKMIKNKRIALLEAINDSKIKDYESKSLIELLNNWTEKLIELNISWNKLLNDL